MSKINVGRVLLGGFATGFVIIVFEFFLNGVLLHNRMEADFKRMNLTPPGGGFAAYAVVTSFVLGIVAILVYSMIRSRLGPGPKTALITALLIWFCVYAYSGVINMMLISVPPKLILLILLWGIIEYPVAILIGAAIYKET